MLYNFSFRKGLEMSTETSFGDKSAIMPRFDKFRFKDDEINKKKRIVFLSKKVIKESVHYIEGVGYRKCLSAKGENCPACVKGLRPSDRFGTHILEYYTDMDGNISSPFGYTVKPFPFGNGKGNGTFSVLAGIHKALGDAMYSQDFLVSCTNPKYQTLSFLPVGTCGLLEFGKSHPADFPAIKEEYTKKMAEIDLSEVIAPEVTSSEMERLFAVAEASNTQKLNAAVAPTMPVHTLTSAPVQTTTFSGPTTTTVAVDQSKQVADAKKMMEQISVL